LIGAVLAGVCWSFLIVYRRKVADGIRRETLAVRASERRYRSLIQNSSDLVLICSEEGIITYQSPSAETIWGYSEDKLINRPLSEMIHSTDRPAFRDLIDQLKALPAASKNIEVRLFRFNGDSRDVDLYLTNLISDVGINGLVVTARDVMSVANMNDNYRIKHFTIR
jgi:PAS domain S-box-containing protein